MLAIGGSTKLAAVIGDPARHSRSPAVHNAAFKACDLDWVYVALDVAAGHAGVALDAMRTLGISGYSVTMPHKADVAAAVDECTPIAAALGAVNCVTNRDGRLIGDNTDGGGFIDGLAADLDLHVGGLRCAVLGAGGAARAVIAALADAGAVDIAVINRSPDAAERAAALGGTVGRVAAPMSMRDADLVINATPLGMTATAEQMPGDPDLVRGDACAVDLIYEPRETPWLSSLARRGVRTANGQSMLVYQAARQFQSWTGLLPPIEVMAEAFVGSPHAR